MITSIEKLSQLQNEISSKNIEPITIVQVQFYRRYKHFSECNCKM